MRTIGRHWPKSAPRGDYSATCDLCGFAYRRTQLVQMPGGTLRCSGSGTIDCAKERDAFTLDKLNADQANKPLVMPAGGPHHGNGDL